MRTFSDEDCISIFDKWQKLSLELKFFSLAVDKMRLALCWTAFASKFILLFYDFVFSGQEAVQNYTNMGYSPFDHSVLDNSNEYLNSFRINIFKNIINKNNIVPNVSDV